MDQQVFDYDAVMQRLANDQSLFRDLVRFFFEDSNRLLDQARTAAQEQDAEKLMRAAHAVKGMAANFNAQPASHAASSIEQRSIQGDLRSAAAALPTLETEIARLQEALRPYLDSPS